MTDATLKGARHGPSRGELLSDMAHEALARSATFLRDISFRSWPYRLSLAGPMPDRFQYYPKDVDRGSLPIAQSLLQGRYASPDGMVQANQSTAPWSLVPPSDAWAETLHGFSWLKHFDGHRTPAMRDHVHWLITTWMEDCDRWNSIAWRPHVIGRRLISWFSHAKLIANESDLIWRSELLCSIARQARHLSRTAKWAQEGDAKLTAAVGLAFSGLCLPDGEHRLEQGMNILLAELDKQILPDGGHVSRNPSVQLSTLADLCMLKDSLLAANFPVPQDLDDIISRMGPMLRFFRHTDGKLALFNGSAENQTTTIDALLARKDTRGKPYGYAPHSGYQRIQAGRTYLIADTASPPQRGFSQNAHAGCLSFEMSIGRHRLIVNCGSTETRGGDWQNASRATAAHSTVTLADKSSARFLKRTLTAKLLGPRVTQGPNMVVSERDENAQGLWLTTSHDGYVDRFGLIHERRLYLSRDGEDLRGEDCIKAPENDATLSWLTPHRGKTSTAVPFSVRFHLHPDVRVSQSRDDGSVIMMLPNGDGWTFRTNWPSPTLEESIYLGSGDALKRTTQIVINGVADKDAQTSIKWAIQRMSTLPKI